MNITDEIVTYIVRNRVSTTEVADCLGKTGGLSSILPINRGHFAVGKVFLAVAREGTNWPVHEMIQHAPKDSVVLIESYECEDRALIGDLVAKYLLLYRQVRAIVVMGPVRDVPRLSRENWPIWSRGVSPVGCWNSPPTGELPEWIQSEYESKYEGTIAVCDDSGVVLIPPFEVSNDFLRKLDEIEHLEDQWYECIDRRKWNTFDTVCLRKYEANDI